MGAKVGCQIAPKVQKLPKAPGYQYQAINVTGVAIFRPRCPQKSSRAPIGRSRYLPCSSRGRLKIPTAQKATKVPKAPTVPKVPKEPKVPNVPWR